MHSSGAVLSESISTYGLRRSRNRHRLHGGTGQPLLPVLFASVETGNDLNGATLLAVTTSTQYDGFGNATVITVSTGEGYSKSTTNVCTNEVPSWLLGGLKSSTVQSAVP